jgi:hypothetical protein
MDAQLSQRDKTAATAAIIIRILRLPILIFILFTSIGGR